MSLVRAGCVCVSFILFISGVQGQANTICALKGSSVDLPCSAESPTSSMTWYTVHWNGSEYVQREITADGNHTKYNVFDGSNFSLTITHAGESDAKFYCCRETDKPSQCWLRRTELRIADLQVKVIPTSEGQTVTLMCSSSCPLTEKPAAYIWYKNREFLYQDWSPWYQQLVSSQEAVTYSCAIKGYEHLRAPEVSVDSVTSTCFSVTSAEGRMCSYKQKSAGEPCSITYPTDVYVQRKPTETHVILTCNTGCAQMDPQTAYKWYRNKIIYRHSEEQELLISNPTTDSFSCAVKGFEDLLSAQVCLRDDKNCWSINYVTTRFCALEGSSVNISAEYSYPSDQPPVDKFWYKTKTTGRGDAAKLTLDADHVEHCEKNDTLHILRIENLKKEDSAEYKFRVLTKDGEWKQSEYSVVMLIVTGLEVKFTPSAVVTEGQRVTLTCSTSCPLTDNTNYIWYFNGGPLTLPQNQNKVLLLDPVSSQHAGNYSCAVETYNIRSSAKTLTVRDLSEVRGQTMATINALRLTAAALIPFLSYLLFRMLRSLTSHTEPVTSQTDKVNSEYVNISLMDMRQRLQHKDTV